MKRLLFTFPLIIVLALTSACGWHLRGTITSLDNVESVHLTFGSADKSFIRDLEQMLEQQGISLVDAAKPETITLSIQDYQLDKRTVSVGSDALAAAYQLAITVKYTIHRGETLLVSDGEAQSRRSYDFDSNQVLSKNKEETLLKEDMNKDLINQLLRRLQHVSQ